DTALYLPIVTHGPAYGHQTCIQARIANKLIRPELFEQLVFRDNPMTMAHEVDQDLKDLWPYLDPFASAPEFIALCAEELVTKDIAHSRSPLGIWRDEPYCVDRQCIPPVGLGAPQNHRAS